MSGPFTPLLWHSNCHRVLRSRRPKAQHTPAVHYADIYVSLFYQYSHAPMTAPLSPPSWASSPSGQAPPSPWPSGTQRPPLNRPGALRGPGAHAPQVLGGAPPPGRRIPPPGPAASALPRGARPAPLGGRRRRGLPAARKRFPGGPHRRHHLSRRPRQRRDKSVQFLPPKIAKRAPRAGGLLTWGRTDAWRQNS